MATTALDIITAAMKALGVLAAGETVSSEDAADGLLVLNRVLGSVSAQGVHLFYRPHEALNLIAGDGDYSIGTGGDFNTARPNRIIQAFIRDAGNSDHEVKVRPISEYWTLGNKLSSTRPTRLYYDPTYPTGTIYFNSVPSEAEALHLISEKPLTSLASLVTEISLPTEYELAIINRVAINIAPNFGKPVTIDLARNDRMSWSAMVGANVANNLKPARVSFPGQSSGTYNVDADE